MYPSKVFEDNLVSIPAWCDWEKAGGAAKRQEHKFQFQLGAIGRAGQARRCNIE